MQYVHHLPMETVQEMMSDSSEIKVQIGAVIHHLLPGFMSGTPNNSEGPKQFKTKRQKTPPCSRPFFPGDVTTWIVKLSSRIPDSATCDIF